MENTIKPHTFSNMLEALKSLDEAGYTTNFVQESGHLRAADSGEIFHPQDLKIVDIFRFEGASNPDDMAIIYVIEAKGGLKGTLVDSFGLYGSSDVGRFMNEVPDARSEHKRVAHSLPVDII